MLSDSYGCIVSAIDEMIDANFMFLLSLLSIPVVQVVFLILYEACQSAKDEKHHE